MYIRRLGCTTAFLVLGLTIPSSIFSHAALTNSFYRHLPNNIAIPILYATSNPSLNVEPTRYTLSSAPPVKDRQSEAKNYVRSLGRAQQTFYREKGRFASNFKELGLGFPAATKAYWYAITFNHDKSAVQSEGIAKVQGLKSYLNIVVMLGKNVNSNTTFSVLCESKLPTRARPESPNVYPIDARTTERPTCPSGYSVIR